MKFSETPFIFSTTSSAPSPVFIAAIAANAPKTKIINAVRFTASDFEIRPVIITITPTIGKMIGK